MPQPTYFTNRSTGIQRRCFVTFLNNCKGYDVVMNHFLPMTLYSEAVEDLIE